jgi:hypothetical protein
MVMAVVDAVVVETTTRTLALAGSDATRNLRMTVSSQPLV